MANPPKIAGIVLAGGQSSRMGRNKALLDYKGHPLVRYMTDMLRLSGLENVFISGNLNDYSCITDDQPFSGPVQAIQSVLKQQPDYDGYLFVPVDMPLLSAEIIQCLLQQKNGGYFAGWPLPFYLASPVTASCRNDISVQDFLQSQNIRPIEIPPEYKGAMKNGNTPQEWKDIINAT